MADSHTSTSTSTSPSAARRAWRPLKWLAATLGLLLALLLVTLIVIANWDWNSARPWVSQKVSEASGREFSIDGDLSAEWHWPQPLETGWKRWIPGLTIQAQQLRLGNPEGFAIADAPASSSAGLPALPRKWETANARKVAEFAAHANRVAGEQQQSHTNTSHASEADSSSSESGADAALPTASTDANDAARLLARENEKHTPAPPTRSPQAMGTIASASATLRLLPLLNRTVVLDTVALTAPDFVLGRAKDGRNNWTFKQQSQDTTSAPWNLSVGQLIVRGGWLGYVDGVKDLAIRARIDTLNPQPNEDDSIYGIYVAMQGRYAKAQIEGEGLAGPILSLRKKVVNYPLHLKARAGSLRAEAQGILANPSALSGMDLQVSLSGASMADLYALTGIVLPSTPAFKTRGRLLGSLEPASAVWEYRDFDGTVGSSDLHGSLTYTSAEPRPRLEGLMVSKKLRLADLGPLVGSSSSQEAALSKKGKVLPEAHFDTARWTAMDLDLAFSGEKIIRPESLPIENLSTRAVLKDGELRLSPLRFGVAQGKINSDVVLDSRKQPLAVQLHGTAEGLKLAALFPKVALMKKSFGQLDGAVSIVTHGDSIATMLGSGSGEMRLFIRNGTFSKELLDLAALNLGSVIVTKLFGGEKEVQLRCAVADFKLQDGLATARTAKVSTDEAIVEMSGTANLKTEMLDFNIKPESLKWKFLSLRTPLYVRGSFADPKVGVEAGPLILRAGAAVAAAVIAPVAVALVPITVPAAQDDADCKNLLTQAQVPVKAAHPPAKSAKSSKKKK